MISAVELRGASPNTLGDSVDLAPCIQLNPNFSSGKLLRFNLKFDARHIYVTQNLRILVHVKVFR